MVYDRVASDKAYRLRNRERRRVGNLAWRRANLEKARAADRARSAAWARANPEKAKEQKAASYKAQREKNRARNAKWKRVNKGRHAEHARRRDATKLRACPLWAKKDPRIEALYFISSWLRQQGDAVHVDHIFPLKPRNHDDPRGLHVYANLRIVDSRSNEQKQNRQPTQQEIAEQNIWRM